MISAEFQDKLNDLHSAYESLQVMAGSNNCDSGNVAAVLVVINREFERVVAEFEGLRKSGGVKLKSVNKVSTT